MSKFYPAFFRKPLLFGVAVTLFSTISRAQTHVIADPALVSFDITDMADVSVDANNLHQNTIYKLHVVFENSNQVNAIPAGTMYFQIALGTRLIVDPAFVLANAPLNNYFQFSQQTNSGQVSIYAILIADLPASFLDEFIFQVKANTLGGSTIVGNIFLNYDINSPFVLDDSNPGNNSISLGYTVTTNLPVTITKFNAVNKNCQVLVNWSTAEEINVDRYEVETSKDGINFYKAATVTALNSPDYATQFYLTEAMKAPVVLVRLKSIDIDGQFKYSKVVAITGSCSGSGSPKVFAFPNPLNNGGTLSIACSNGLFNGAYKITLTDAAGRTAMEKDLLLNNQQLFTVETGNGLAAGLYYLRLRKPDGSENTVIKLEKF